MPQNWGISGRYDDGIGRSGVQWIPEQELASTVPQVQRFPL